MGLSVIELEPEQEECPQCGSTENEMSPDGICVQCWMENEM